MKQKEMFAAQFVPRKYSPPREKSEEELYWPVQEISHDLRGINNMFAILEEEDELGILKSVAQYFTHKYGKERGYICFLLWRKVVKYLKYFEDELNEIEAVRKNEDNVFTLEEEFLKHLVLFFTGKLKL